MNVKNTITIATCKEVHSHYLYKNDRLFLNERDLKIIYCNSTSKTILISIFEARVKYALWFNLFCLFFLLIPYFIFQISVLFNIFLLFETIYYLFTFIIFFITKNYECISHIWNSEICIQFAINTWTPYFSSVPTHSSLHSKTDIF